MMGRRRSFAGLLRVAKASGAATAKGDFSLITFSTTAA